MTNLHEILHAASSIWYLSKQPLITFFGPLCYLLQPNILQNPKVNVSRENAPIYHLRTTYFNLLCAEYSILRVYPACKVSLTWKPFSLRRPNYNPQSYLSGLKDMRLYTKTINHQAITTLIMNITNYPTDSKKLFFGLLKSSRPLMIKVINLIVA